MATSQFPTSDGSDINKLLEQGVQGMMAAAVTIPEVVALGQSMLTILRAGTVTPEQEADIRAQLDATRQQIDKT